LLKSIIFDLGGVLYDIDFRRSTHQLALLGVNLSEQDWAGGTQGALLDQLEKGEISSGHFLEMMRQQAKVGVTIEEIKTACCALLIGFKAERINLLQQLRQEYRLFLLSNTNPFHIATVNKQLQFEYGVTDLRGLFDHAYYSFEMGLRKPNAEIFTQVLNEQGLLAGDTLFIDDALINVNAAVKLGLQVLHKPAEQELYEVLPSFLGVPC
jgi:glucose-1-phosphatase